MNALPLIHAAITWFWVGLIWTIQIVHYPLFAKVGTHEFASFEAEHQRRIGWIVVPAMLGETLAACLLVLFVPSNVPALWCWAGLLLVAVNVLATLLWLGPLHALLAKGWNPVVFRTLLIGNWLRTIAWTLRGLLALAILARSG